MVLSEGRVEAKVGDQVLANRKAVEGVVDSAVRMWRFWLQEVVVEVVLV